MNDYFLPIYRVFGNMKKKVFGRQFSRSRKAREAMFKALLGSFLMVGKITTTKAKVSTLKQLLVKYQKIAAKNTLASRRMLLAAMFNKREWVDKLMALPTDAQYKETNLGARRGDGVEEILFEVVNLVEDKDKTIKETPKVKPEVKPEVKKGVKKEAKTAAKTVTKKTKPAKK